MRHRKDTLKLGRTGSHRKAMFRNMVTSLFKHDRIRTTDVKAKELRRWADHLITLAKRGDLHARRMALSIIRERDVVQKLFDEAVDRYGGASGGYTRIIKVGRRPGDAAPVSIIELISETSETKKKEKKPKKEALKKATPAPEPEPVETEAAPEATAEETSAAEAEAAPEPAESEVETTAEEESEETSSDEDEKKEE